MAIAFDAAAGAKDNSGSVTSLSWTHTTSGSNRLLFVGVSITTNNATTITGVTYNGVSLTQFDTVTASPVTCAGFYLINPATGANTVQITLSGVLISNQQIGGVSQSYTGCQQSAQPDSHSHNSTSGTNPNPFTVSTTVVGANCWLVGAATEDQGAIAAGSAGSGTTYRGVVEFNMFGADSNATVGTGSQSLNWGRAGGINANVAGIVMSVTPFGAATITNASFLLKMI